MRIRSLCAQRGALLHAEAMLFVDHHKLQILEDDRIFNERMRTNDNFDRAVCESLANDLFFRFWCIADQQADLTWLHNSIFLGFTHKQTRETAIMLPRQNRGG